MFRELLTQKQAEIVRRWQELTMRTYPEDAFRFLKKEKDRFANPVGYAIVTNLELIFGELCAEMDPEALRRGLDGIVRIRAVQDFNAGQALCFILLLKDAVREILKPEELTPPDLVELLRFETRIDQALLLGFDLYMQDREKVYDIRANELRARSAKLVERLTRSAREPRED
jgi:hypothetical protein